MTTNAEDICEASIELYGARATILNDCNRGTQCIQVISKEIDKYGKPIVIYVYATNNGGAAMTDHREIIGEMPFGYFSETREPEDVAQAVNACAQHRASMGASLKWLDDFAPSVGENVDLYA